MENRRGDTLFQNYNLKDNNEKIKTTVIPFDDEKFISEKIVAANELESIDLTNSLRQVKIEDVNQQDVENCFFLSVLSTLIENDPTFLKNIISYNYNKRKFYVTLFDSQNPDHRYIYVLDPTKVVGRKTNRHTHDIIFILEKAYSLHRILLEPTQFTAEEQQLLDLYIAEGREISKTVKKLEALEQARKVKMTEEIREEIIALLAMSLSDRVSLSDRQKELLNLLREFRGGVDLVLDAYIKKQVFMDVGDFSLELKLVLNKEQSKRIDYVSGLTCGWESDAFIALLGSKAKVETILIAPPFDALDILKIFLPLRTAKDISDVDGETSTLLKNIFGNMDTYLDHFICSIKNTPPLKFVEIMQQYQNEEKSVNPHKFLKKFFREGIDWIADTNNIQNNIIALLDKFVEESIRYKRGLGKYTKLQLELYQKIRKALMANNLVTAATRELISGDDMEIKQSKGLVKAHSYMVLNCFESDHLIYFLLRNPWGRYVREYSYKQKMIGDEQVQVLTAIEKDQLSSLFATKAMSFVGIKDSPRSKRKDKIARPGSSIDRKEGIFPLTLDDLGRRFETVTITERPKTMPAGVDDMTIKPPGK